MRRAWNRINSFPTQRLRTPLGTIDADQGDGVPLLVSDGILGCHVDTVDSWWARLPGPGFPADPCSICARARNASSNAAVQTRTTADQTVLLAVIARAGCSHAQR
jgi:hypothetical protein